jgi:cytidylate kinase
LFVYFSFSHAFREHGPLKKAEGAVEIDTTTKSPEEVLAIILAEIRKKTDL